MLGIILFIGIVFLVVYIGNMQEKLDSKESIIENKKQNESTYIYKKHEHCLENFIRQYILKYRYSNESIAGVEYQEIDYSKLDFNLHLDFKEETDNQYDHNAIKIYQNKIFLGYVHKGFMQDMLKKYLNKDEYCCLAFLTLIDEENKILNYEISFYKEFNEDDFNIKEKIAATLIKTTKKAEQDCVTNRQDSLSLLDEKDIVQIEEQFDSDCLLVTNYIGEELGELNNSVSNKLRTYINNDDYNVIGKVIKITENSSGNYGAKIDFIIINNH